MAVIEDEEERPGRNCFVLHLSKRGDLHWRGLDRALYVTWMNGLGDVRS